MTRTIASKRRLAILILAAGVAGPIAYAQAHESTVPTINGTGPLGPTYAGGGSFDIPGITLDCPPPQGGPICHIAATVRSRTPLRLRNGGPAAIRVIGKVTYDMGANGDLLKIYPAVLTAAGTTALNRYGKVPAYAHITNKLDGTPTKADRTFKLTVKPGYAP